MSQKCLGPGTQPSFFLGRQWAAQRNELLDADGDPTLLTLERSNVVMHSTAEQTPRRQLLSQIVGKNFEPSIKGISAAKALRCDSASSPFSHFRFKTNCGKILAFKTGNVIRAGKWTHGDACAAALLFQSWMFEVSNGSVPPWPSAISTPNSVLTGQYKQQFDQAALKAAWTATETTKFPGIAITIPGCQGVTPQLFFLKNKFIIPGPRSCGQIVAALNHISKVAFKKRSQKAKDVLVGANQTHIL